MSSQNVQRLTKMLSHLPGLGPRSGRRLALHLLTHQSDILEPLMQALEDARAHTRICHMCGTLDDTAPCALCTDPKRDQGVLCVVATIADLWAFERSHTFFGRYHVLGGTLSAVDGIGPDQLKIASLIERCQKESIKEVVFALSGTIDAQTTLHFVASKLRPLGVHVSSLAHGIPLGGELDYLDQGTLQAAYAYRQSLA